MLQISSPQNNVLGQVSMAVKTPEIQSITILEGDQDVTASEVIQYVNLPRDSRFVNPAHGISHIDRLGRKIRCKVTFNTVGQFKFKVKLIPKSSNVVYTATEKANNINFCYSEGEIEFTTDSTGEKIIEADKLFVTPAGNDVFTISAEDSSGNIEKTTTEIRTKRMFFYTFAAMPGTNTPNLSNCFREYEDSGIVFNPIPTVNLSTDINIIPSFTNEVDFITFTSEATTAAASATATISPYGIIFALAKNLGNVRPEKQTYSANPKKETTIRLQYKYPLWIENNDIANSNWFFGGEYTRKKEVVKIEKTMCVPIQSNPNLRTGWYDCIDVNLSKLPKKKGEIRVILNTCDIKGGYSIPNTNILVLSTKILGNNIPNSEHTAICVHEIGHQLGQAADGNNGVDKSPTHYAGNGHNGNHCYMGVGPSTQDYEDNDAYNSTCVMFGFAMKTNFCPNCETALKKMDLSVFPI